MYKSALEKGKLILVGEALHDRGEMRGANFREDPLDDIEDRDGPELANIRGPQNFRDQSDNSQIQSPHHESSGVEFLEHGHDDRLEFPPESLEERYREAIRARGGVGLHRPLNFLW